MYYRHTASLKPCVISQCGYAVILMAARGIASRHTKAMTRYLLEETYEVVEAIEEKDIEHLAEELGDLLLQVYLHAEIARQDGNFSLGDIYEHVSAKLIRRHPHVFGNIEVDNANQVAQNWEAIKRRERAAAGKDVAHESLLDGVPPASPALSMSQSVPEACCQDRLRVHHP